MWTFLRLRPWWQAPLLLLRRPGVALALAAAALVAAVPAAGTPLFTSASQAGAVADRLETARSDDSGVRVAWREEGFYGSTRDLSTGEPLIVAEEPSRSRVDEVTDLVRREIAAVPNLSEGRRTLTFDGDAWGPIFTDIDAFELGIDGPNGDTLTTHILSRQGYTEHTPVRSGSGEPGLWLPDTIADDLGVGPGDEVAFGLNGLTVTVPVGTVYRSMLYGELPPFWEPMRPVLKDADSGDSVVWPDTVLLDEDTFWILAEELYPTVYTLMEFELADVTPSPDSAHATVAAMERFQDEVGRTGGSNPAGDRAVSTEFPRFVERADLVESSLRFPVGAISAGAVAVGLIVVGAAALLWTRRRHTELVELAGRGAPPWLLGVKAAGEAAPALLVGVLAGWGAARLFVSTFGPSHLVSAASLRASWLSAALVLLAALLMVAVTAAAKCRSLTDAAPAKARVGLLAFVPWELGLLGLAVGAWSWMSDDTLATSETAQVGAVEQLPGRLFVVPVLAALAAVILAARVTVWLLRSRRAPRANSWFLAKRRLSRDRLVSAAMLAGVAVPVALAGYGTVATDSVASLVDARARAAAGSDVVLDLSQPMDVPPAMAEAGVVSQTVRLEGLDVGPVLSAVLFVDPETFPQAADVTDRMIDRSLADVFAEGSEGNTQMALAGGSPGLVDGPTTITIPGQAEISVEMVTVEDLPGRRFGHPVTLVPMSELPQIDLPYTNYQWWVRTDDPQAVVDIAEAELGPALRSVVVAEEYYDSSPFEPVTHTFGYLNAVTELTSVVVVVGILLHVESRSPADRKAWVLMRRMGMRPRSHRAALLWEFGVLLFVGAVLGSGIALGMVGLLADGFDLDPGKLPEPFVTVPVAPFAAIGAATVAVAMAVTWFAHARIARADPAEVLRDVG